MYVVRQTCLFIINDCMKYLVDITLIYKKDIDFTLGFFGGFFVKILQFCVKLVSMGDFGKSMQNIKFMGSQFFYYNLRMSSSNKVEVLLSIMFIQCNLSRKFLCTLVLLLYYYKGLMNLA